MQSDKIKNFHCLQSIFWAMMGGNERKMLKNTE